METSLILCRTFHSLQGILIKVGVSEDAQTFNHRGATVGFAKVILIHIVRHKQVVIFGIERVVSLFLNANLVQVELELLSISKNLIYRAQVFSKHILKIISRKCSKFNRESIEL